jgi:hypothetical protein
VSALESRRPSVRGCAAAIARALATLPRRPATAYAMLLLLQLKVVWGLWDHRDLMEGDTSDYLLTGYVFHESGTVNLAWTPLYSAVLGLFVGLFHDAVAITLAHRLAIVFLNTALVLAVMRRLLTPGIAWVMAAWWALLPVGFHSSAEVHLFAVVPILVAWLIVAARPTPRGRGAALAVLLGATVLVRNEYVVTVALFAGACLLHERRRHRRDGARAPVLAYLAPLALAGLVVVFFYSRSIAQGRMLVRAMEAKHTRNLCQAFSFGYRQRHPEWTHSPWVYRDCEALMREQFGAPRVTGLEMAARNPRALLQHVLWNARLAPTGIQLLLFGVGAGRVNPDYLPWLRLGSTRAAVLAIAWVCFLGLGLLTLARARPPRRALLRGRETAWSLMLLTMATTLLTLLTQRPRPSYLIPLGLFLLTASGLCLSLILERFLPGRNPETLAGMGMIAALLIVSPYYSDPLHWQPLNLRTLYKRLHPFADVVQRPDSFLMVPGYTVETFSLVARVHLGQAAQGTRYPRIGEYDLLNGCGDRGSAILPCLAARDVNLVYVEQGLFRRLSSNTADRAALQGGADSGWRALAYVAEGADPWALLQRVPAGP